MTKTVTSQNKEPPRKSGLKPSLFRLRHRAAQEIAGLPDLLAAADKIAASVISGEHTQRKSGSGEKFWQFREYDPADRPQDIDWRQSAKGDRVYIRQKEWQTPQKTLFWCQNNEAMAYRSDKKLPFKSDSAQIASLALAMLLSRAGEQVGTLDGQIKAGHSPQALEKLGARTYENKTQSLPPRDIATPPVHSAVVLTGDFLAPLNETEYVLRHISAHAGTGLVIQILDPAELTLPFDGRVIFENMTGDKDYQIEHVPSIKTEYIQRINNHLAGMKALCRKYQWHWLLHRTDRPLKPTLLAAIDALAKDSIHMKSGGHP